MVQQVSVQARQVQSLVQVLVILIISLHTPAFADTRCSIALIGAGEGKVAANLSCHGQPLAAAANPQHAEELRMHSIGVAWGGCSAAPGCMLSMCGNGSRSSNAVVLSHLQLMHVDIPDLFGVLCIAGSAQVAIQGASVSHNTVSALVASDNAQVAITGDSIFLNNTDSVKGGGGIYASGNAFVQVQDVLARNNSNGGEEFGGGFIRAIGNASIELVNCTLEGNFGGGAGAFVRDNASVSVKGGSLIDNVSPEGYAGGVFYLLGNGTLSIQGPCLLQGNQADYGAAIYADSNSRLYIGSDVAFKQNRANLHATLYIEGSVVANLYGSNISFVDNHAELNGGAIYADSDSIVNITGSSMTFSDNQATASGGAIFMSDYAQLSMEPQLPVFVNNSAVVGGVMYAGPNNKVFVSNRSFLSEPDVSWLRKQCLLGEVLMHKGICVKCPPDSYSFNTTAHRCDLCPEHAKCGGGSHVAPVAGYWHSTAQSVQLHACPNAAACEAGGTCAEGYAGPVCGSCTEGYGLREPFQCSQCHGAGRSVGLYLAGWVVMVSLVVYTWHNTARDNQQATRGVRPSDILKVLIPFCQYLAILSCLNVSWPRSMVAVLNGLSQLFGMGHVAFVDCLVNQGLARPGTPLAVQRLLLSLFTPCAVLVAAVLLHLLVWLVLRFMLHKPRLTFRAYFWDRVVIIVLTVLFMFYPNFVRAGTSSFACFHLDVAGEGPYPQYSTATAQHGYFVFDLQQECYRGYHLVLVLALAVPTALFFCVIVPLGIWAGLYFNRSSLSHRKVRQQYGSLYHAYKQQYYYWESIVCVQTVLLVCIAVFSSELGVFYSALLLNAAFVGSLLLQVAFRPYACRMVHQLQMQASACLYLVTLLALTLLSLDRESPPTYQEAAGVVVLLLIICFVLSCCWRIHCILKEQGLIMRMVWPVVRWLRRRLVACGCKKTSLPLTSLASTTSATHVALNSMPSMVSAASVSVAQGKMMPDDSGVQPAALPAGALADDVCDDGVHDGVHDGAHDGVLPGGCLDDASDSLGVFYTAQHKEGKLPEQQHCNDEVGMQADKDVDG